MADRRYEFALEPFDGTPLGDIAEDDDGTGLRQISDILDDDPSVAWSPDGARLLVYGGWGSYLVDVASGDTSSLPYLVGYGSIAWLPD